MFLCVSSLNDTYFEVRLSFFAQILETLASSIFFLQTGPGEEGGPGEEANSGEESPGDGEEDGQEGRSGQVDGENRGLVQVVR